jgi:hypothetical protein
MRFAIEDAPGSGTSVGGRDTGMLAPDCIINEVDEA